MSTEQLTAAEREELARHDKAIKAGKRALLAMGRALRAIRDSRLYRESYDSFEKYCRNEHGLERSRVYHLIEYADTVDSIDAPNSYAPPAVPSEAAARVLKKVPEEKRAEVWQQAVETAPQKQNGQPRITAGHVAAVADPWMPAAGPEDNPADEEWSPTEEEWESVDEPAAKKEPNLIGSVINRIDDLFDEILRELPEYARAPVKDHIVEDILPLFE